MAGDTIEQVVVKFIADNASYLKDIKNMQEQTQKYGVYTSNLLEKLNQNLNKTSTGYKKVTASAQQFHKTSSSGAMAMFQHYTNLGAQLGFLVRQYVSLYAAVRTVTTVMKEGINFNKFKEETTVAFTVMMRSADAAKAKMEELYSFAVKSPLTFQETAKGARQLMAYGFAAEELVDTMKMLGTVGKAVGASMDDMAYVYGTLRAQGRAYSRDLLQFGMRGIPIYEELAKVMDVNVSKIQKLASEGEIGFSQVEKAFVNMTNTGGRFGGILDAWMSTLAGKSSMLADVWQKNAGEMTKGLFESLKKVVETVTEALESSKVQKIVRDLGISLGLIAESTFSFVKALIALRTPILILASLSIFSKISQQLAITFITLPKKIYEMSLSLAALTAPTTMASGAVLTLKGAINSLTTALAANPIFGWVTAITLLISSIPLLQAKLASLEADTKEKLAAPGSFRTNFLKEQWLEQIDYLSYGGKVPLVAIDYISIAQEIADKWGLTIEDVLGNAKSTKVISDNMLKQIDAFRKQNAAELAKRKGASNRSVVKPSAADIPQSLLKVAEASFVKDAQSLLVGITGGYALFPDIVSSWTLMGKEAISSFVAGTKYEVGKVFETKSIFGESMPTEDVIKLYEKSYDSIITYYNLLKDAEEDTGQIFDTTPLTEYANDLRIEINRLQELDKTAKETEKAFTKYNDEISKMSSEIDKYMELGFNPTKIQEIDYEFKKLTEDMDTNKGIWEYITDPQKRNYFKSLFGTLSYYQKEQIKEAQAFELANAKLSKELEYQLALMEGQAFYANQELAMFDAQLESQKQLLQLTIDRGGEGVDAAKQELEWVIKIGEVQRRNLEKELALTRAKRFLAGEGTEEFWNQAILRVATKLGMPQYENGTGYVPNTGPAILHKGEAVIPAEYMNYLRTEGEKFPFPTRGMQETIDSIINKFIFFGWYKDKNDFINKRQRQIKAGTWKQASALKTEEQFLFSTPEADYYFDPDASTTGTAQAITMGRNIIINPFSTGYQGQDIVNHELGHVRSFNLFGASNMEKLAKKDVYFSLLDKAREANATYLKIYKEYLSRILSGETGLAIDSFFQDKLRPAYDTALQLFRDYQNTDIEVIANWLGGVYGSFANESNWEDVLGFYANGTGGAKRGPAIVGEKGPELVYMNGGETVIPNHMLNGYYDGTDDSLTLWKERRFKAQSVEKQAAVSNAKFLSSLIPEMADAITGIGNEAVKGMEKGFKEANKIITMRKVSDALALSGEQAMGSEVGKMVAGGDPLTGALASLASFVSSIENVTKLLNPFSTIIEGMAPIVEPLINGALKPLVDVLITVGEIIGKMLAPILNTISIPLKLLGTLLRTVLVPLEMMGQVYEWLNDKVIVPFGNAVIDIMNGIIKLVNKLPGINIAYIDHLQTIEEITKQAERLTIGADALTQTIDYFTEKLREEVDKQLNTYQDLYELGLMTASEYEENAVNLNKLIPQDTSLVSNADKALTDITDIVVRLATLLGVQDKIETEDLSEQTILALYDTFGIATTAMSKSEQYLKQIAEYNTGKMDTNLADIVTNTMETANKIGGSGVDTDWEPSDTGNGFLDAVADIGEAVGDVIEFVSTTLNPLYWVTEGIKSIFGFASGTSFVPSDMMANIHKGEMIIPQTFSDSIRNGELVLGSSDNISGGAIYNVTVNVQGSVLKENDLAASISTAIRRGTKRGFIV